MGRFACKQQYQNNKASKSGTPFWGIQSSTGSVSRIDFINCSCNPSKPHKPLVVNGYRTGKNLHIRQLGLLHTHSLEDVSMVLSQFYRCFQSDVAQRTTGFAMEHGENFAGAATTFPNCIWFAHTNPLVAFDRSGSDPKTLASLCRG